ncbi:hypothetical protein [Bradyrhizobium elkanii]|uniref:hypothetical protein n=1 Tax=Bradyrhizobium elkanii TaxID=29448 RepID=UPI0035199A18
MTAASRRRRKKQPFNPAHDRRAQDLLRNAQVAPAEVDDPYEQGGKLLVLRSTRDDPLAEMLARGQITECDFAAGRHWQWAFESAEIGSVCGIDPSKEAVDGGRMNDPISDRRDRAGRELKRARDRLGASNWLVTVVLGTRKSLIEVAKETAGKNSHEGIYRALRAEFHKALETLAIVFGYTNLTRA